MEPLPHACEGCDRLPPEIGGGTLYVVPPLGHTLGVVRREVAALGLPLVEPFPGALAIGGEGATLGAVLTALGRSLTDLELDSTQALLMDAGASPGLADVVRARPLRRLVAQAAGAWLSELLAAGDLVTHFQPIVHSATPERVFAHECLTRGRRADGSLVPPLALYRAASETGLLFRLDRDARIAAIRSAAAHRLTGEIFINFRPSAIYNPAFCLRSTARAVQESGIAPERIVFEVVESEEVRDTDHLLAILRAYRDAGFRVALDDLGSGYGSLNLLHKLRPEFVKLDMGLTRGIDADPVKATLAAKLLEAAAAMGIPTIAEGVETAAEWAWLRDHGAIYQQGYLFARPASPPPVVTAPEAALAAAG